MTINYQGNLLRHETLFNLVGWIFSVAGTSPEGAGRSNYYYPLAALYHRVCCLACGEYDTPKIIAERNTTAKDPVHTVHAFEFVKMRLQDLVNRVGGEAAFQEQWAVNVDKDILDKFQAMARAVQQ